MHHHKTLFGLFGMAILALLVAACNGGSSTSVNNITVVNLEANDSGCTPKNIETQQGFLMKLSFKNSGAQAATFNMPDVPFTLTAPPGQTVLGNFTAPTATGKYDFTCGPADKLTHGELQVKNN
ncbi:MAG: hypothetical protein HDKAJFGB_03744 [Anaerolineae bacterium]|nr:hypothetical protein [Anaerolineae bacterium]